MREGERDVVALHIFQMPALIEDGYQSVEPVGRSRIPVRNPDGLHSLSDINSLQQGSPLWNTFGGRADHEGSRVSSTRRRDDETEGDGD